MFCGKCGTENPDDSKYCLNCGADLEKMKTPSPRVRKSIGEKPTAGGKVSTTDFRQSIGEMKTILSDEDIALLFDKGALISDRYEIKDLLGKGGMGVVYQVYDNLLKDDAALKLMLPSLIRTEKAIERFINEAKISLKLSHENIVRIRDIGEFKGIRYISMEYLEGNTLRQLLAEKKKSGEVFSLSEALRIIFQICDGLSYAHKYTVHRDIKPENIIILPDSKVKIMDFGIAKLMSTAQFTPANIAMGTAYYMAPEQSADPTKVDHRADIYSVGVILHEMLTSNIPMGSFQFPSQINPELPDEIDDIIEIALRPLPEERYQNIEEFKKDLDGVVTCVPDLIKELKEKPKAIKERVIRRARKAADLETDRIICPNCQTINSRDKYFCVNCGENLKVKCPQCQSDVNIDLTYCGKCGVNIAKYREDLISGYVKSAKEHITKKNFDLAKKEMEKIEELGRKHPAIAELHSLIIKEKEGLSEIKKIVSSAADLLRQKNYNRASEEADKVLKLEENHTEAVQIVEKVKAIRNEIKNLKAAIKRCINNLQLNEAQSLFEKLIEMEPLDSQLKAELSRLQKKLRQVDELKGAAKRLFQDKEYAKALEKIRNLTNIVRDHKEVQNLYKDVTTTLKRIEDIEKKADDNLSSRRYIEALKLYEQLKELKPKDRTVVNKINIIQSKALRRKLIAALVAIVIAAAIIAVSLSIKAHKRYLQEMDNAYNIAVSLQQKEKYIQADERFKQFLTHYPDSKYVSNVKQKLDNIKEKVAILKAEEDRLMQEADILFDKKQFLIPADNNAVKKYKQVLNINSENQHAKERMEYIINFYLQKAQEAFNNKRYLSPLNDNALKYINNILSIESENELALNIKEKIAAHYQKQADNSWNEENFAAAKRYYQSLQVIYPDDELIKRKIKQCNEEADFNNAKQINTLSNWKEFLAKYQKSTYADYAWRRIIDLSPWIMFKHDLHRTGRSQFNGPATPHLKWTFLTGGDVDSSPVIGADGTIYVGSGDGKLYAINPDGSKKWAFATGGVATSSPAIGLDGTIYMGAGNGKLYAVSPDGSKKWEVDSRYNIISSPAIGADGTIYIGFQDGKLYAINPDGSKKWAFTTGNVVESAPAVGLDGTIYIRAIFDGKLYAINPDGRKKWEFDIGGWSYSSPTIGLDGTIYIGSRNRNKLYAISPNGSKKWEFPTIVRPFGCPAIASDGTIYIGSDYKNLYAINPNGSKKWEFATLSAVYSSPAIGADGTIYVGSWDRNLYAINQDGRRKWAFATGGVVVSSPAIGANGTIYVGARDDKLYAIGKKY